MDQVKPDSGPLLSQSLDLVDVGLRMRMHVVDAWIYIQILATLLARLMTDSSMDRYSHLPKSRLPARVMIHHLLPT